MILFFIGLALWMLTAIVGVFNVASAMDNFDAAFKRHALLGAANVVAITLMIVGGILWVLP